MKWLFSYEQKSWLFRTLVLANRLTIMQFELDDTVINSTGLTNDQLRLALAIQLYATGRLTKAQARRLTNLDRIAFADELGKRGLGQEYTPEMLEEDLKTHLSKPIPQLTIHPVQS